MLHSFSALYSSASKDSNHVPNSKRSEKRTRIDFWRARCNEYLQAPLHTRQSSMPGTSIRARQCRAHPKTQHAPQTILRPQVRGLTLDPMQTPDFGTLIPLKAMQARQFPHDISHMARTDTCRAVEEANSSATSEGAKKRCSVWKHKTVVGLKRTRHWQQPEEETFDWYGECLRCDSVRHHVTAGWWTLHAVNEAECFEMLC